MELDANEVDSVHRRIEVRGETSDLPDLGLVEPVPSVAAATTSNLERYPTRTKSTHNVELASSDTHIARLDHDAMTKEHADGDGFGKGTDL